MAKLLVDQPDLVLNLVDTLRGSDALQTSIPGALELAGMPYTGAGMRGLVIGNDRNLVKELLDANDVPTPPFQFVTRRGTPIRDDLGLPLIVKLNESGGSVGIDNDSGQGELRGGAGAGRHADRRPTRCRSSSSASSTAPRSPPWCSTTASKSTSSAARRSSRRAADRKYLFTSFESYNDPDCYHYTAVDAGGRPRSWPAMPARAFEALRCRDYAKFDVRIDPADGHALLHRCQPQHGFWPRRWACR